MKNLKNIKSDFPIFGQRKKLIYLDNAATTQKPKGVIKAVNDFYTIYNSNVHRGIYSLSQEASVLYEKSREKVSEFIGAKNPSEIIFTSNGSEAINLVAYGFGQKFLKKDDIVVLSEMEHHSNLIPWLRLEKEKGIRLFFIPINSDFQLNYQEILQLPKNKIKLVALTHVSNVLGTINPVEEIIKFLELNNIKAKVLIDAAQSVPHLGLNVAGLKCDFLTFSSHKMLGPSGVGILWAKKELLEQMEPLLLGSHMVSEVNLKKARYSDIPAKFEVGTRSLEGVFGFGAAIDYLKKLGMENIKRHQEELNKYFLKLFCDADGITLYGSRNFDDRIPVFSFNVDNIHPHDVSEILNRHNICVRSGHHCAMPLLKVLKVPATVRASFYIYNSKEDIDKLFKGLESVKKIFN